MGVNFCRKSQELDELFNSDVIEPRRVRGFLFCQILNLFTSTWKRTKVVLTALYLGEGSKTRKGSLAFGNSDPYIISLFLNLLRKCYKIDEKKFRCTIQCRADQNIKNLEEFWTSVTKIPLVQFYKARIDPRTIGKPSKKLDYKGVCRIDCFSGEIYLELMQIPKIIYKGLVA
jgi:hypothetical protein